MEGGSSEEEYDQVGSDGEVHEAPEIV